MRTPEPILAPMVKITTYGQDDHPAVVLVCPHAGKGDFLLEKYPALVSACPCGLDTLREHLGIEEDFGSDALAHAIAGSLTRRRPDLRVDVVEIMIARGVVDGNRVNEIAVQSIFDFEAHPELFRGLQDLHRITLQAVGAVLDKLPAHGMVVDVHSMASYNPSADPVSKVQAVSKTPATIRSYNNAYLFPKEDKPRRFCVVTATDQGEHVADARLADLLGTQLTRHGIGWAWNEPYPTANPIMSTHYMRRWPGITFDVPKNLLAAQKGIETARNLARLTLDRAAVEELAEVIAVAIYMRIA